MLTPWIGPITTSTHFLCKILHLIHPDIIFFVNSLPPIMFAMHSVCLLRFLFLYVWHLGGTLLCGVTGMDKTQKSGYAQTDTPNIRKQSPALERILSSLFRLIRSKNHKCYQVPTFPRSTSTL